MAGAGFKTFVDGDILTAAQVNTYLMQQSVMVFASAAARTTAIAAPSEGMVTYLADNDLIEYYDGAAWQPLLDQDVIAAKGDLIVGTGDDTVAALSVGTNGHVLTADSSTATGLKWAAAAGGGKVLQVVQGTTTTTTTVASTTYTDTTLTATITPSSATSKIMVVVTQHTYIDRGSSNVATGLKLLRDATTIVDWDVSREGGMFMLSSGATSVGFIGQITLSYLDSPSTTSATTYKLQGAVNTTANTGRVIFQVGNAISTIQLIEIGA